jgi:hypothetical protein
MAIQNWVKLLYFIEWGDPKHINWKKQMNTAFQDNMLVTFDFNSVEPPFKPRYRCFHSQEDQRFEQFGTSLWD